MPVKNFYELDIWKEAHRLSLEIYKITKTFPVDERFGITDQIRRASTSVGANIAEGFGRFHYKEKIKFYYIARGSSCEVQNFIFMAQDLGYIKREKARRIFSDYDNLNKKINNLISSVGKTSESPK
ncbi:MAG: Ribosomal protein S23 [Candidatus Moranbacteria bacterium GW2011_GWD2_38_7]|nr:MAG: Ribosomal protein S23 [Candidatus Moranbacteria bacterium GW2011_GWD2_38_7]